MKRNDAPVLSAFPDDLVLTPIARWPTTLPEESQRVVLDTPIEQRLRVREREIGEARDTPPQVSIVIVTLDGLVFTRLCLESLLAMPTLDRLRSDRRRQRIERRDGRVSRASWPRATRACVSSRNDRNTGFAAATNQRRRASRAATVVVLLNNDTIVDRRMARADCRSSRGSSGSACSGR